MPCIHSSYISRLTVTSADPKLTHFKNLFDHEIVSETVAKVRLYSAL